MTDLGAELLFEMSADLAEPQDLGTTPAGTRRIIAVTGGAFSGPKLKGAVLPGGADWLLVRPDGVRQLDVRATLRTDDGHLIYISYRGLFDVTPEVFQRLLRGEAVPPSEYYFRITPVFETGAEKYGWLNRLVTVGVGTRTPTGVAYTVYAILESGQSAASRPDRPSARRVTQREQPERRAASVRGGTAQTTVSEAPNHAVQRSLGSRCSLCGR